MPDSLVARRQLLRRSLEVRLREVTGRIVPAPEVVRPEGDLAPEAAEEMLRVAMVRLWPRVRSDQASKEERAAYLSSLAQLARLAITTDWRFLDVMNNAYETLVQQHKSERDGQWQSFLQTYAAVLRNHLDRLVDAP